MKRRAKADRAPADELLIPLIGRDYLATARPVIFDIEAWRSARQSSAAVQWPLPEPADSHGALMALLFESLVAMTANLMHALGDAGAPALPPSLDDERFRVLLRVCAHAHEVAEAEVRKTYGGQGATGWREWKNQHKARGFALAVESGLPRAEALDALGLKKSSAYRQNRKKKAHG